MHTSDCRLRSCQITIFNFTASVTQKHVCICLVIFYLVRMIKTQICAYLRNSKMVRDERPFFNKSLTIQLRKISSKPGNDKLLFAARSYKVLAENRVHVPVSVFTVIHIHLNCGSSNSFWNSIYCQGTSVFYISF